MLTKPSQPRIDIYDDSARTRWAERLGITEAQLREAVRRFGTSASTVRAGLGLPPG